jgi:hypothetical protein
MYEQPQIHYSALPVSILPVKQHKPSETKQESLMNCKISGSHSSVVEDSSLLGHDFISLAKWPPVL